MNFVKPIVVTVSGHGGMFRKHSNVTFTVPPKMRVAVFVPPYCALGNVKGNGSYMFSEAHKVYEPGSKMPEMTITVMHTPDPNERFAVREGKLLHKVTVNGRVLKTKHFPELARFKKTPSNDFGFVERTLSASQFLSMLLNRYGENRWLYVKFAVCRSDPNDKFPIITMPSGNIYINKKNIENHKKTIKRLKMSSNKENVAFAERFIKQFIKTEP